MMKAAPSITGGLFLAACNGEPANWLEAGYLVGEAKSACTVFEWTEDGNGMTTSFPAAETVGNPFAEWESRIRAQGIDCKEDSDLLAAHAWAECTLTAPALLTHPLGSRTTEAILSIEAPGQVRLRASVDGVSCRTLS